MDRKINVIGIENYDFNTPDGQTIKMANLHYTYSHNRVNGLACGRVAVSQKFVDRYSVNLGEEYIGVFYVDGNKREKLAGLFVEG